MSEKPRCRTCPHAHNVGGDENPRFVCELNPPVMVPMGTIGKSSEQPRVLSSEGCSYYPGFPAWLTERAKSCS